MTLLQTSQHCFADWRIFGIFKNDQNVNTSRFFQSFFDPVKYTLGCYLLLKNPFFANITLNKYNFTNKNYLYLCTRNKIGAVLSFHHATLGERRVGETLLVETFAGINFHGRRKKL